MKNKAVKIGFFASLLPHIFCCGMPIVLSVISLFAPELAHTDAIIPEWIEPWLFVFSAGMLGVSWVLVVRDCHCACNHCHGSASHHMQKIVLAIVTIIFIISILLHLMAHN